MGAGAIGGNEKLRVGTTGSIYLDAELPHRFEVGLDQCKTFTWQTTNIRESS
jgi:hypothetical protein